jgi:hypothetical protein
MAETDGTMMKMVKPYWLSSRMFAPPLILVFIPLTPPCPRKETGVDNLSFSAAIAAPQFGAGVYCGNFPMSPHNVRVAYQTWDILERAPEATEKRFGKNYVYRDGIAFGGWLKTWIASWVAYSSVLALLYLPPVSRLAGKSHEGKQAQAKS